MARTAAMPDPAEDIPPDRHLGQSEGDFEFGAPGPGVSRTDRIGTVIELADQLHRAAQSMEAAVAMIADVHHPPASWTASIQDVEFPQGKIGVRRPPVRHPGELRDYEPAIDSRDRSSRYVKNPRVSSPLPDR